MEKNLLKKVLVASLLIGTSVIGSKDIDAEGRINVRTGRRTPFVNIHGYNHYGKEDRFKGSPKIRIVTPDFLFGGLKYESVSRSSIRENRRSLRSNFYRPRYHGIGSLF
jgi:hypothetical protein